jgi:hypothetical protein
MHCPSCLTRLHDSARECQNCGFTLGALDLKFGTVPKTFTHLSDWSSFFTEQERLSLDKHLTRLEHSFEGLHVAVVTMEVDPRFSPREYLFWMMNRCGFTPLAARLERCFSFVLFFESNSRTAFLSTGYGLNAAFPEEELSRMLEAAAPHFKKEQFYRGTTIILRHARRRLRAYCKGEQLRETLPKAQTSPKVEGESWE